MLQPGKSVFPMMDSPQRSGSTRKKVVLKPGHSLMDWIRHTNSGVDVQGNKGQVRPVSPEELSLHASKGDCWLAVRGQVYNVSAYIDYHPGGEDELMRGAGKDATDLFDEVHKWVNYSSMLAKCYVGPLKSSPFKSPSSKAIANGPDASTSFLQPGGAGPQASAVLKPRYDWYQSTTEIHILIYTSVKNVAEEDIILDCCNGKLLNFKLLMGKKFYWIHLDLDGFVIDMRDPVVSPMKIQVTLVKKDPSVHWSKLGTSLKGNDELFEEAKRELEFRNCKLHDVRRIAHNVKLFSIDLPRNVFYCAPLGHHVIFDRDVEGVSIRRNYTVALPSLFEDEEERLSRGRRLHFMVKVYPEGAMTSSLDLISVGDTISLSDCTGDFSRDRFQGVSNVFLIAAGTGFTPMIRILRHIIVDRRADCDVSLLFANRSEEDVLWRDQLNRLAETERSRFGVTFILSRPNHGETPWSGPTGRVTQSVLEDFFAKHSSKHPRVPASATPEIRNEQYADEASSDSLILICGPDAFTRDVNSLLLQLGHKDGSIHCFLG